MNHRSPSNSLNHKLVHFFSNDIPASNLGMKYRRNVTVSIEIMDAFVKTNDPFSIIVQAFWTFKIRKYFVT